MITRPSPHFLCGEFFDGQSNGFWRSHDSCRCQELAADRTGRFPGHRRCVAGAPDLGGKPVHPELASSPDCPRRLAVNPRRHRRTAPRLRQHPGRCGAVPVDRRAGNTAGAERWRLWCRLRVQPDRAGLARLCLHPPRAECDRHIYRRLCSDPTRHRAGLHRAGVAALSRANPHRRGFARLGRWRNRHLFPAGHERRREAAALAISCPGAGLGLCTAPGRHRDRLRAAGGRVMITREPIYAALFMRQKAELASVATLGAPTVWTLVVEFYVYAHASNPYVAPATVLNPLIDGVEAALAPLPATGLQNIGLSAAVQHAYIAGKIETEEGVLRDQAVAIIPVQILCL